MHTYDDLHCQLRAAWRRTTVTQDSIATYNWSFETISYHGSRIHVDGRQSIHSGNESRDQDKFNQKLRYQVQMELLCFRVFRSLLSCRPYDTFCVVHHPKRRCCALNLTMVPRKVRLLCACRKGCAVGRTSTRTSRTFFPPPSHNRSWLNQLGISSSSFPFSYCLSILGTAFSI